VRAPRPATFSSAALLFALAPFVLARQDAAPPTVEQVQARLAALEGVEVENEAALAETYRSTLDALGRAAELRAEARTLATESAEAPRLAQALRDELATPPAEPEPGELDQLSLAELERGLGQTQADLGASRVQVEELAKLADERAARQAQLPKLVSAAQQALAGKQEELAATPPGPESEARRFLLLAEIDVQRALLARLEAERARDEAQRELVPLRRDRAARRLAQAEEVEARWKEQADERRRAEGEAAARAAEQQLEEVALRFPTLEQLAERTRQLAARRSGDEGLPRRISEAQRELEDTRGRIRETDRRFGAARKRIAAGGLTEAMGAILRRDLEWLPSAGDLRAGSAERDERLSRAQLELIGLEEERFEVGDVEAELQALLEELAPPARTAALRATARDLLAAQRAARDAVLDDLATLTASYYEHKELSSKLLASAGAYREFIERRILWVRSSSWNPIPSLLGLPSHALAFARAAAQASWASDLSRAIAEHPLRCFLLGALWIALVAGRGYLARKRVEMGSYVRSYRTDRYVYTVRGLVQTLLLALPLPLFAGTLGWLLSSSAPDVPRAVGSALREIAWVWLTLRFLRGLLADRGVGAAHFKWPSGSMLAVRRELRWFEPLAIPFTFVALAFDRIGTAAWSDSIGRAAFLIVMGAQALFSHRVLREDSGLWPAAPRSGTGLLVKTHRIWSLAASGLPVALGLLAVAGYHYTALQLELRLRYSIGLALALVLMNALLLRWLFLTRRRLAVAQALELRARREEEAKSAGAELGGVPLDADQVDIPAVDAQTRQLFKSSITLATVLGLYFIWAGVLPALQGLDRVQLLPRPAIVAAAADVSLDEPARGAATSESAPAGAQATPAGASLPLTRSGGDASGATPGATLGLPSTLTLADVLLASIFLMLTSVAARNLPALLELSLLQRLPLDRGARYAVTTLVRYLVVVIGISAMSGALGIGWGQIQWLVAALTFGLAFGLQEIFANFVSGVIILIERPIRVGDIVTVGETEGRVTRLRMRATTIQDWDRRELLVPNKELITGSVINWTLSDPVTRVVVPVGIAYGSDTALARDLLIAVAHENPHVLEDPAPSVLFRRFGESTLDFELRVFIENRDLWPALIDRLHTRIDDAFRAAGIEIAFPQRDVHIRSLVEEGGVKLLRDALVGSRGDGPAADRPGGG